MVSITSTRLGQAPEEGIKAPVIAATSSNETLQGLLLIGTTQTVAGDRILVRAQTIQSENGIYIAASGAWSRSNDWNQNNDVVAGQLVVASDTSTIYQTSFSGAIDVGVTNVTFPVFKGGIVFDTFAALEASIVGGIGQQLTCVERANANYIVKSSSYTKLNGDATLANGLDAELQIDASQIIGGWFGLPSLDESIFNDIISRLPAEGGRVFVPENNYSSMNASLILTGARVIVWELEGDSIVPSTFPYLTFRQGNRNVSGSTRGSPKPCDVFFDVNLGTGYEMNTGNQNPRVFHVEGTIEDHADHAGQSFLHAYSFFLTTKETTTTMGEVRGVKGHVIGDGGNSTVRAGHVIAEGFNGFTGQLTGWMATADHADATDAVFNNVAGSTAIRGQVGAGTQANFIANTFGGVQRPTFAYQIDSECQPEEAVYQGHGGGNGAFQTFYKSDVDNTPVYNVDQKGRTLTRSIYSGRVTIDDDAVSNITTPEVSGSSGLLEVFGIDNTSTFGKCYYRVSGSNAIVQIFVGTNTEFTTGNLTGTTGNDLKLTVSARTDGTIDIENRTGAALTVGWLFITSSDKVGSATL